MSVWLILALAVGAGAALIVWNTVSQTKQASGELLKTYREMLAEARERKRAAAEEAAAAAQAAEAEQAEAE